LHFAVEMPILSVFVKEKVVAFLGVNYEIYRVNIVDKNMVGLL